MADALLSPLVGGAMTAVSGTAIGLSVKRIGKQGLGDKTIPMMGVMGAFVFAAQMVNFTIPGTGSSGHIGGGILLAALLGPFPALITLSAVLLIQCLFFADGGLLAYGCNVFNIGVCVCLAAYMLVFKPIVKRGLSKRSLTAASVAAAVLGLQIGSFCVVLQTLASGVTELPFAAFALLMQPIHLAIGLIEGLVTAAVLCFVHSVRPEMLDAADNGGRSARSARSVWIPLLALTLVTGGLLSLMASPLPDGLEWSMEKTAGTAELANNDSVHEAAGAIVDITAVMPDYGFGGEDSPSGTAAAGLIGSAVTLLLAGSTGLLIHLLRKRKGSAE